LTPPARGEPSGVRAFGRFKSGDGKFYGEVRGNIIHRLRKAPWLEIDEEGTAISLREVEIDVPVEPSKLLAVGLNYADHIAEMKRTPLGTPLIWFKAPSSLLPHNGTIEIAYREHQTQYELELGVVIGTRAKNVSMDNALDYVFGYTIGEDISDRDLQSSEKQFARAKSFDTYTPVGPFLYSGVDVTDLAITLRQNGEIRQEARTSQMIYSVAEIVSFASQNLTLLPGDLILTGTPSGVGPIRPGDRIEGAIGDWSPLVNSVAAAPK